MRLLPILGAGAMALVFLAGAAPVPPAKPSPVTALSIMREVEARFRAVPRVIQLDVETHRPRRENVRDMLEGEPVRLWGVFDGEAESTSVVYVFTAPRRLQGTGLLIRDPWDAKAADYMGYHMRSFRRFQDIPRTSLKLLVAGTCLTYEEARGFLSTDKYDFAFADPSRPPGRQVVILAKPKDPSLEKDLGFRSLRVSVDRDRLLLLRIETTGLNGQPSKTYEAGDPVRVGDLWLAGSARVHDLESSVVSVLRQRYFPLSARPPAALFDAVVDEPPLLDRFLAAVKALGIEVELEPKGTDG
jgi:hypothetical protein